MCLLVIKSEKINTTLQDQSSILTLCVFMIKAISTTKLLLDQLARQGVQLNALTRAGALQTSGTPLLTPSDLEEDASPTCVHFPFSKMEPARTVASESL